MGISEAATSDITADILAGVRKQGEPLYAERIMRLYDVTLNAARRGLRGIEPRHVDIVHRTRFVRLGGQRTAGTRKLILAKTLMLVRLIEEHDFSGLVPLPSVDEYGPDVRNGVRHILVDMGLITERGHVSRETRATIHPGGGNRSDLRLRRQIEEGLVQARHPVRVTGRDRELLAAKLRKTYERSTLSTQGVADLHGISKGLAWDLMNEAGTTFRPARGRRIVGSATDGSAVNR